MSRKLFYLAVAGMVAGTVVPQTVDAQGRGKGQDKNKDRDSDRVVRVDNRTRQVLQDRNRDRDSDRDSDRRYDDRRNDDRYQEKSNGPKFCRNGEGHPVHGRQWCRDKGYGLGNDGWRRATWEDVVLRRPRSIDDRSVGRSVLDDILGSVILGRFDAHRRDLGGRDSLTGRWVDGGSVLRLHAGSLPVAQLIDSNRDGRVEAVLLYTGK